MVYGGIMATTEQAKPTQEEFEGMPGSVIGRVVCLAETPSLRSIVFRLRPEATTTAGKLVAIEAKDNQGHSVLVLSRVSDIFDHNPHEDPLSSTVQDVIPFPTKYAAEGHSTVIYRAAKSEPLEQAIVKDAGQIEKIRSVATLWQPAASIFAA